MGTSAPNEVFRVGQEVEVTLRSTGRVLRGKVTAVRAVIISVAYGDPERPSVGGFYRSEIRVVQP